MAMPLLPSVNCLKRAPSLERSLKPLNQVTLGTGLPKTSNWAKMVSFSCPDHLSHGLSMNLAGPSPLGCKGVDSLSQL